MWAREANSGRGFSLLQGRPDDYVLPLAQKLVSPTLSASLITQDRDSSVAGQWYSDDTLFFNLSLSGRPPSARGRFEAMPGDYRGVGDLFFLPPQQRYLARGGPGTQRNLFVEMRLDQRLREELGTTIDASPVLQTCMNLPFDRLRDLLLRIASEVRQPGFASEILIEGLGVTLLAETLRVLRRVEVNAARKGGLSPWRLRAIEARIRDGEALPTLAELADLCGLSRRQLMRAFREETGRTVGAFVQDLTLERAKQFLCETDLPIGEVAARLGFTTATSFSTAFRRSIGENPRSFRASRGRN